MSGFDPNGPEAENRAPRMRVVMGLVLFAAVAVALLVVPGRTVTTMYVNDLLIFIDGAWRILQGQVPNRDFHTALGPMVFYAPALGMKLSGDAGTAMPWATALYAAVLLPALLQILATRLPPLLLGAFGAFLVVVAVMPLNPGDGLQALSFAMFYNRIGWVALAGLMVLHLPPDRPHRFQFAADLVSAVTLVVVMGFTKASYAAAAGAFLLLAASDPAKRRLALGTAGGALAAAFVVDILWGGLRGHIEDLLTAVAVSGGPRDIAEGAGVLLRNLPDHVIFLLVAVPAWLTRRSLRDLAFFAYALVFGFLLIRQNFQGWGIMTLHAGMVVGAAMLLREARGADIRGPALSWVAAAALLPTAVHGLLAIGLHAALASERPGRDFGLPHFSGLHLARTWTVDPSFAGYSDYLDSLADGAAAIRRLGAEGRRIVVLDFVSPFSAGLGLPPPKGDNAWHHWGRNFDMRHHLAPEDLLADALVVMEPKRPIEEGTARALSEIYGRFLAGRFDRVVETPFWRIRVRGVPDEPLIASGEGRIDPQRSGQTIITRGTPSSRTSADSGAPSLQ